MRDVDVGRDVGDAGAVGAVGRDVVLQLRQVGQRFGVTEVLRGLDLSVYRGERLAIIGPNGAGKSTLFNVVSGRTPPSSGSIWLHGQRVDGLPPFEIHRRGLARSFQVTNVFPQLSVYENLRCATLWSLGYRYTWWRRLSQLRDANARTEHWLHQMRLHTRRDVPAMHLSYAEQRALELGIALAGGADVVLLDEPTAGMSQSETRHFVALIHEVTQGKTLLVVEHDMSVVFSLADRVAVLVNGELLALDSPAAVRANPAVQAAYLGTGWDVADAGGAAC